MNSSVVMPLWAAATIPSSPFSPEAASVSMSLSRIALNGCVVLPFRVLWRHGLNAVEGERDLEIDRLLGPQRSVIVERRDTLGKRSLWQHDPLRRTVSRRAGGLVLNAGW